MTTKNEELQGQSQLVRTVAACLEIKLPAPKEIQFRGSLLRKAISELATIKPAFLVRLFEAACGAEFPDADVVEFRLAVETALAKHLGLAEFKAVKTPVSV